MIDYTPANLLSIAAPLKALANENRLQILHWLSDPECHFPPQQDGDLVKDGVCVGFITEKIGLRQPTVTNHMRLLQEAGLVTSKKIKNWVFYRLVPARADEILHQTAGLWQAPDRARGKKADAAG
ncbi:metalloregulator ArsR/SmtB family transcription factor [Phaeobacter sp. QD34_3]|uniref:ArsR/SmtB family transcription factor n=1 Tax=unclassified Phaeobacter TaxID=2621772 RepID=UPI00237F4358|nr:MULTISPECIES: metalloregulator ArsR/SmtB family transcription factor [unclassified Phaeobacter]MDE4131825.1 metalloregulator ArsR/SmtB family transcription factor [Phaeobacter sp. QD34_3]MDE4135463.1 metalloregulator ArsR/SmtB family transcription factor [Phaeobacter sp. QD34_24]